MEYLRVFVTIFDGMLLFVKALVTLCCIASCNKVFATTYEIITFTLRLLEMKLFKRVLRFLAAKRNERKSKKATAS